MKQQEQSINNITYTHMYIYVNTSGECTVEKKNQRWGGPGVVWRWRGERERVAMVLTSSGNWTTFGVQKPKFPLNAAVLKIVDPFSRYSGSFLSANSDTVFFFYNSSRENFSWHEKISFLSSLIFSLILVFLLEYKFNFFKQKLETDLFLYSKLLN